MFRLCLPSAAPLLFPVIFKNRGKPGWDASFFSTKKWGLPAGRKASPPEIPENNNYYILCFNYRPILREDGAVPQHLPGQGQLP